MNFPQFWAKERGFVPKGWWSKQHFECWGWSDLNMEDAQRVAREKADRIAQNLRVTHRPPNQYSYGTRPFREQVLRRITDGNGRLTAAISRNQFGCLILNTSNTMFVDIDFAEPILPQHRIYSFFFKPKPTPDDHLVDHHLQKIERWTAARENWSWQIYRTRGGLRLLAPHAPFEPTSAEAVFQELGADPLYQKLCANQKSFRARLTPKPWRIGLDCARVPWPRMNDKLELSFNRWEKKYLEKSEGYATCRLIKTIGSGKVHPEIAPILHLHDEATRAKNDLPLA
ncbi:MAG TPA: hypothetical protein VM735_13680 [Candidatus Kapabacteria bacterium]|nr:hypothetical protein [Candidatus Kapabacteria bacterium]